MAPPASTAGFDFPAAPFAKAKVAAALYPRLPVATRQTEPPFVLNIYAQLDPLLTASAAGHAFAAAGQPARARTIMANARTNLDAALAPRTDDKGKPLDALKAATLDVTALRRGMAAPETSRTMADYQKAQSGFISSFFAGPPDACACAQALSRR